LHRIVTDDEKWIHYDNPKKRKSWGPPGYASTSIAKPNIHRKKLILCLVGSAWCRVLWVAQTERDHYWGSLPNTIDEIESSTQGKTRPLLLQAWQNYSPVWQCSTTCCGAGQNLLRNTQIGSSIPPAVFFKHCSFRLLLVPIDDAWPVFTSYEDTKNYIDDWIASKDEAFFRRSIHMLLKSWEKVVASDDHYFE